MSPDGVLGGVWLPTDGYLDPSGPRLRVRWRAPVSAARRSRRHPRARHRVRDGRVHGVASSTGDGTIAAESWCSRAGCTRPRSAALAGVNVPIVPMAHQYLITKRGRGRRPDLPQLRDPDNLVYFREEVDGLLLGGYERDPAPWSLHGVPADFNNRLLARRLGPLRADDGRTRPPGAREPTRRSAG